MRNNNQKIASISVAFIVFILFYNSCFSTNKKSYDFVPDEKTAVKIAEAILYPIYGDDIFTQKPFKAKLINKKFWIVKSTLPKNSLGGTYSIRIRKSDCKILGIRVTK